MGCRRRGGLLKAAGAAPMTREMGALHRSLACAAALGALAALAAGCGDGSSFPADATKPFPTSELPSARPAAASPRQLPAGRLVLRHGDVPGMAVLPRLTGPSSVRSATLDDPPSIRRLVASNWAGGRRAGFADDAAHTFVYSEADVLRGGVRRVFSAWKAETASTFHARPRRWAGPGWVVSGWTGSAGVRLRVSAVVWARGGVLSALTVVAPSAQDARARSLARRVDARIRAALARG